MNVDNQQERLSMAWWITGFVDGEGCFAISFIKNKTTRFGYQAFPEFVITQGAKSLNSLERAKEYFGCGSIVLNKRYDNHHEHLYRYCVRANPDLRFKIIPHFKKYRLKTNKMEDFKYFEEGIKLISNKKHLTKKGWEELKDIASKMNRMKRRT
jgi:hypothetical protein